MILLTPFLVILGLMQLVAAHKDLRGLSLTGRRRWLGYTAGAALLLAGALLLPATPWVLPMVLPASMLALLVLAAIGSLTGRSLDTARFLRPGDWPEARCRAVRIPNGGRVISGLLVSPPTPNGAAVCLVHGSGDNKTAFKWRLIRALLDRGLSVLTVDLAGHGENQAPQRWPDCVAEIPAALDWLRDQPGIGRVGLLGISMGGALSAHAAVVTKPDAVAICEAPVTFQYSHSLVRREVWNLLRSPILDVMREVTAWQIWRMWDTKPGRREIALSDLIHRLDVPGQVAQLSCPLHLVYGQRDKIAPPQHGEQLLRLAPGHSQFTVVPGASHLALILMPHTTQAMADWFAGQLDTTLEATPHNQVTS